MDEILQLGQIFKNAYLQSDIVGKLIVIVLGAASIIAWSIMLYKYFSVLAVRRSCMEFLKRFDRMGSALRLGNMLEASEGPLQAICKAGMDSLMEVLGMSQRDYDRRMNIGDLPRALTTAEIEKIRASMVRCLNLQRMMLLDQMVILSTIVSLSPYCGLFGTVWGVMMTFVQLAAQQGKKPDLGQLAPGVSGALLTTVVGLLVAIPSVAGNNIIMSMIDKICSDMDTFVDDFIASLRLEEGKTADKDA